MKKTFLTFVLMLAVAVLQAQTLIKANFNKGDKAIYEYAANFEFGKYDARQNTDCQRDK